MEISILHIYICQSFNETPEKKKTRLRYDNVFKTAMD
jgi:hypothetical protein